MLQKIILVVTLWSYDAKKPLILQFFTTTEYHNMIHNILKIKLAKELHW